MNVFLRHTLRRPLFRKRRVPKKILIFSLGVAALLASCNEPSSQQNAVVQPHPQAATVLVGNSLGESITRLSLSGSGSTIERNVLITGLSPSDLEINGNTGYLVNSLSHTVQVIDLERMATLYTISTGLGSNPMDLALSPASSSVTGYVSAFITGEILHVDLGPEGGVLKRIPLSEQLPRAPDISMTKPFPGALAVSDGRLFAALSNLTGVDGGLRAGGPGVVAVIPIDTAHPLHHSVETTLVLTGRDTVDLLAPPTLPGVVLAASAGDYAGGFLGNGAVEWIDSETLQVQGILAFGGSGMKAACFEVCIVNGNGYIADARRGRVLVFDIEQAAGMIAEADTYPVDLTPTLKETISLAEESAVLSYVSGFAAAADTLYALEFNHDRLFVIDTETNTIEQSFITGDGPDVIAVWKTAENQDPETELNGLCWFGRILDGAAAALDGSGTELARTALDGNGTFTLEADPQGTITCTFQTYRSFPSAAVRSLESAAVLRSLAFQTKAAVTPLSELAFCLAEELGDASREGRETASKRLTRHLADTHLFSMPDDPLTEEVEGSRSAGLVMAALVSLSEEFSPGDPNAFLRALARDAADGFFDGASYDNPVPVNETGLPADLFTSRLADAIIAFSGTDANKSCGEPDPALLSYLHTTSGILPPPAGDYDAISPSAVAGPDQTASAGTYITFDGTMSSDNRAVVSFRWDFDRSDGLAADAEGGTVHHAYLEEGIYEATLTVKDAAGNRSRDSCIIEVTGTSVHELSINPKESYLYPGEAVQLTAFYNGTKVDAAFVSSNPHTGTMDANGIFTAQDEGQTIVDGYFGGAGGQCLVHVIRKRDTVFYNGVVFRVEEGTDALFFSIEGTEKMIPLPAGSSPSSVAVWGGVYAFAAGAATVVKIDIASGEIQAELPFDNLTCLTSCGDYIFACRNGHLVALDAERHLLIEGPGDSAVSALASDSWGRLWTADGESITIFGPRFSTSGGRIASYSRAVSFAIAGADIGGFCFSPTFAGAALSDRSQNVLHLVPLPSHDPFAIEAEASEIDVPVAPIHLSDVGPGISDLFSLGRGVFIAESRKEAQKYTVTIAKDFSLITKGASALNFAGKPAYMLERHEQHSEPHFADVIVDCSLVEHSGSYMNPLLALGPPRGRGLFAGSTDVVSLGDRRDTGATEPAFGGSLTLGFAGSLVTDGPGPDLVIFENPFREFGGMEYSEVFVVSVSQDGETWIEFPWALNADKPVTVPERFLGLGGIEPVHANYGSIDEHTFASPADDPVSGGDRFDLASIGLQWIRYVRITDGGGVIEDPGNAQAMGARGADIDAAAALFTVADPFHEPSSSSPPEVFIERSIDTPLEGEEVILTAIPLTDHEIPLFYAWDLDPGSEDFTVEPAAAFRADALGREISYVPRESGPHTVAILVIDGAGRTGRTETTFDVHGHKE